MFVDYNFYMNEYGGMSVTEEEFNRFGNLACMYISTNTLSRITDKGIFSYPEEIQKNAKFCACALIEHLKQIDTVQKTMIGGNLGGGIVSSKSAGAVSVSYDTKLTADYFLNQQLQAETKRKILTDYFSPICIDGKMYNLLSRVIGSVY